MSVAATFVIPDIRALTRLVAKRYTYYDYQRVYGMVFEFVRFFRLKQKLGDVTTHDTILAPSHAVDQVWHLFLQDTAQYQQACGASFVHYDPYASNTDASYHARLKRTREEYAVEYHELPPAEFWQEEQVVVVDRKRPRESASYSVIVKPTAGRPLLYSSIPVTATVSELRTTVSKSSSIPFDETCLIVHGRTLEDGTLLSDYSSFELGGTTTVHLVRRPK